MERSHQCFSGKGSGTWATSALAAGLGVPVVVFGSVALPQWGGTWFYYGLYYCSQGMFQLGDKYWETYATHMYEMMLKFQKDDGSWPQGGGQEGACGSVYSTAMAALALSVSYRQLPIYQR